MPSLQCERSNNLALQAWEQKHTWMVEVSLGQSRFSLTPTFHSALFASERASLEILAHKKTQSCLSHCLHTLESKTRCKKWTQHTGSHFLAVGRNILLQLFSKALVIEIRKIKTETSDFITNVNLKRCHAVSGCSDKLLVENPKILCNNNANIFTVNTPHCCRKLVHTIHSGSFSTPQSTWSKVQLLPWKLQLKSGPLLLNGSGMSLMKIVAFVDVLLMVVHQKLNFQATIVLLVCALYVNSV
jgi:hypothetical protein